MKHEPQEFVPSPALTPEAKSRIPSADPLPMTADEVARRGWPEVDVVVVTGDAYLDHPRFAAGRLARLLEADGLRVAVLSQPDPKNTAPWESFGRPRLGFCITAGERDSMLAHYTPNRRLRADDPLTPGGRTGRRPDRASLAYAQRARQAYPDAPIVLFGAEAALRRFAHFDAWSDKVRRSLLIDAKASLLVYGPGESALCEIYRRLDAGEPISNLRDIRSTAYRIAPNEDLPEESETLCHLPSYEEVCGDRANPEEDRKSKKLFLEMTKTIGANLDPASAKTLVQEHGLDAVAVNPPSFPAADGEAARLDALPFTRKTHPLCGEEAVPAIDGEFDAERDAESLAALQYGAAACMARLLPPEARESLRAPLGPAAEDADRGGAAVTLIAGFPGFGYREAADLAVAMKSGGIRPDRILDFVPIPLDPACAVYWTGLDLETGKPVHAARTLRERRLQHALFMYDNPAFYHDVKTALHEAGREDLIGSGPGALVAHHLSKAEHLRQSSRVRRLKRNQELEKAAKERARQEYREREEAKRRKEDQKKKFGSRSRFARSKDSRAASPRKRTGFGGKPRKPGNAGRPPRGGSN
ncbi:MAG: DUF3362 domain-containing protein [Thermoguttaceae bacterium]|nr:DUF3362 domain-containing protein [Thermoguttaceae bacterium]